MQRSIPPTIHPSCSTAVPGPTAVGRSFCTLHGLSRRLGTTPASRSSPQVDPRGDVGSPSSVLHSLLFPVSPHTSDPSLSRTARDTSTNVPQAASSILTTCGYTTSFFSARVATRTHWAHSATHTAGPRALNISIQISTFRI